MNGAARDLREMMLTEDRVSEENLKSGINTRLASAREMVARFKSAHGERDGLAAEYEATFNQWVDIANRAVSEIEKGNKEQAKQIILNECSPVLSSLSSIARRIDAATTQERNESEKAFLQGNYNLQVAVHFHIPYRTGGKPFSCNCHNRKDYRYCEKGGGSGERAF